MNGKPIPHEESKKIYILVVKGREKKGEFFFPIFTNEEPEIFLILFFLNFYFTVKKNNLFCFELFCSHEKFSDYAFKVDIENFF